MSWRSHIDDVLMKTSSVSAAVIIALDGNPLASSGLMLKAGEGLRLVAGFDDPETVVRDGIHINGVKYYTLKADSRSVYGKLGKEGVICVKTSKAVTIGYYNETIVPGEAAAAVEMLADYLLECGY